MDREVCTDEILCMKCVLYFHAIHHRVSQVMPKLDILTRVTDFRFVHAMMTTSSDSVKKIITTAIIR